jgi:mRNA interferase HicA
VNGFEFEKRVKRLARSKGLPCYFVEHGKGSHGRLYLGNRFTTLKDRRKEIGKGLLAAMCKQLKINPNEL